MKTFAELITEGIWEETKNEIHFRLRDPAWFRKDTFRRKELPGVEGVSVILGKLLPEHLQEGIDPESMVIQAYRFAKAQWTIETAKTWVEEHQVESDIIEMVAGVEGTIMNEETEDPNPSEGSAVPIEAVASKTATVVPMPSGRMRERKTPEAIADELLSSDRMRVFAINATSFRMQTEAAADGEPGKFWFTLCHTGANFNGDMFTHEELKAAVTSVPGRKVDLNHWQGIADIVGQIMKADYVEENGVGRIDCEGELFTTTYQLAMHAHTLMQRGIIGNVSMECDFTEGECSICHKKWNTWFDECSHQWYRGGTIAGLPVYRILHGVQFTGVGLLDRAGADEDAKISAVADKQRRQKTMSLKKKGADGVQKTKAASEELMMDPTGKTPEEMVEMIKALQEALTAAETEIQTLKQAAEEAAAAKAADERKAEASRLIQARKEAGIEFTADEEKAEMEALCAMNSEQFEAAKATQDKLLSKASKQGTQAGVSTTRPVAVPDQVGSTDYKTRAERAFSGAD